MNKINIKNKNKAKPGTYVVGAVVGLYHATAPRSILGAVECLARRHGRRRKLHGKVPQATAARAYLQQFGVKPNKKKRKKKQRKRERKKERKKEKKKMMMMIRKKKKKERPYEDKKNGANSCPDQK